MKKSNAAPKPVPQRGATKTHHKTGYHKPIKNPSTNTAPDPHKLFCKRCMTHNGRCPVTGAAPSKSCSI